MIINYLKIALRNIFKDKYSTLLYFLILTIGISSFSVIVMVVDHELSFDQFHKDADSMYRITTYFKKENGQEVKWAITNGYLPTLLKEQIPEVESAVKFQVVQSELSFNIEDRSYILPERSGYYADSSFFSVFDFPLLYGNKHEVLSKPNMIVLSEDLAIKLFGKLDVIGEKIEWDFGEEKEDLIVNGVMKNIPHNSHLQFDFLISGTSYGEYWEKLNDPQSGSWSCHVYFKVKPETNYNQLNEKIKKAVLEVYDERIQYPIQKFTDIYYNANNLFEETPGSNILYVRILLSLSILIFFIVAINYSILTASKSLKRHHEIGIRKTMGSNRRLIGLRFIIESSFFSLICGVISLGITQIFFQFIISRFIYEANLSLLGNTKLIIIILLSSILLGILSGIYTATGSLNKSVIDILKGKYKTKQDRPFSLRNILVIFQFVITGSLIAGNVIILKQLKYIESKDLGYSKDYIINISKPGNVSTGQFMAFAEELKKETCVKNVGYSLYKFISDYNATSIGVVNEKGDTVSTRVQWNSIDEGLIPTLNMQLINGRNFSDEFRTDTFCAILNEAAVKSLSLKDPIGKKILNSYFFGDQGKIIGVIKDFHFQSFNKKVIPVLLILNRPGWSQEMLINISSEDIENSLSLIKARWEEAGIISPLEFTFLDSWFQKLVKKENTLSKIVILFTGISILLACLGLVGLVRYTTETRQREIGIRKVFGATRNSILKLINLQFIKQILLAFVIMVPLSHLAINRWLNGFEYHTKMGVFDYLFSILLILVITIAVVSFQANKASRTNPVDVLKDE